MWNSCAVDILNNLLKINFNGKLRAEISSAVLCSQRVTCLHKSEARAWHQEQLSWQHIPGSQAGRGAGLAGTALSLLCTVCSALGRLLLLGALLTVSSLGRKREVAAKWSSLAAPVPSAWLLRGDTGASGQHLSTTTHGREVTASAQCRLLSPGCFSLLHSPVRRAR